jgi:hypothetical protein
MSDEMTTADIAEQKTSRQDKTPLPATTHEALLEPADRDRFHGRWTDLQARFVDAPRDAVGEADTLVAELMKHLAETFAHERADLEGQWSSGENVSTEELRVALTRYRSFFDRLLET